MERLRLISVPGWAEPFGSDDHTMNVQLSGNACYLFQVNRHTDLSL